MTRRKYFIYVSSCRHYCNSLFTPPTRRRQNCLALSCPIVVWTSYKDVSDDTMTHLSWHDFFYGCIIVCIGLRPDFSNNANDSWCASVGRENGKPLLYENYWTDKHHYVCHYNCKYRTSVNISANIGYTIILKCFHHDVTDIDKRLAVSDQNRPEHTQERSKVASVLANGVRPTLAGRRRVGPCRDGFKDNTVKAKAKTGAFLISQKCDNTRFLTEIGLTVWLLLLSKCSLIKWKRYPFYRQSPCQVYQ